MSSDLPFTESSDKENQSPATPRTLAALKAARKRVVFSPLAPNDTAKPEGLSFPRKGVLKSFSSSPMSSPIHEAPNPLEPVSASQMVVMAMKTLGHADQSAKLDAYNTLLTLFRTYDQIPGKREVLLRVNELFDFMLADMLLAAPGVTPAEPEDDKRHPLSTRALKLVGFMLFHEDLCNALTGKRVRALLDHAVARMEVPLRTKATASSILWLWHTQRLPSTAIPAGLAAKMIRLAAGCVYPSVAVQQERLSVLIRFLEQAPDSMAATADCWLPPTLNLMVDHNRPLRLSALKVLKRASTHFQRTESIGRVVRMHLKSQIVDKTFIETAEARFTELRQEVEGDKFVGEAWAVVCTLMASVNPERGPLMTGWLRILSLIFNTSGANGKVIAQQAWIHLIHVFALHGTPLYKEKNLHYLRKPMLSILGAGNIPERAKTAALHSVYVMLYALMVADPTIDRMEVWKALVSPVLLKLLEATGDQAPAMHQAACTLLETLLCSSQPAEPRHLARLLDPAPFSPAMLTGFFSPKWIRKEMATVTVLVRQILASAATMDQQVAVFTQLMMAVREAAAKEVQVKPETCLAVEETCRILQEVSKAKGSKGTNHLIFTLSTAALDHLGCRIFMDHKFTITPDNWRMCGLAHLVRLSSAMSASLEKEEGASHWKNLDHLIHRFIEQEKSLDRVMTALKDCISSSGAFTEAWQQLAKQAEWTARRFSCWQIQGNRLADDAQHPCKDASFIICKDILAVGVSHIFSGSEAHAGAASQWISLFDYCLASASSWSSPESLELTATAFMFPLAVNLEHAHIASSDAVSAQLNGVLIHLFQPESACYLFCRQVAATLTPSVRVLHGYNAFASLFELRFAVHSSFADRKLKGALANLLAVSPIATSMDLLAAAKCSTNREYQQPISEAEQFVHEAFQSRFASLTADDLERFGSMMPVFELYAKLSSEHLPYTQALMRAWQQSYTAAVARICSAEEMDAWFNQHAKEAGLVASGVNLSLLSAVEQPQVGQDQTMEVVMESVVVEQSTDIATASLPAAEIVQQVEMDQSTTMNAVADVSNSEIQQEAMVEDALVEETVILAQIESVEDDIFAQVESVENDAVLPVEPVEEPAPTPEETVEEQGRAQDEPAEDQAPSQDEPVEEQDLAQSEPVEKQDLDQTAVEPSESMVEESARASDAVPTATQTMATRLEQSKAKSSASPARRKVMVIPGRRKSLLARQLLLQNQSQSQSQSQSQERISQSQPQSQPRNNNGSSSQPRASASSGTRRMRRPASFSRDDVFAPQPASKAIELLDDDEPPAVAAKRGQKRARPESQTPKRKRSKTTTEKASKESVKSALRSSTKPAVFAIHQRQDTSLNERLDSDPVSESSPSVYSRIRRPSEEASSGNPTTMSPSTRLAELQRQARSLSPEMVDDLDILSDAASLKSPAMAEVPVCSLQIDSPAIAGDTREEALDDDLFLLQLQQYRVSFEKRGISGEDEAAKRAKLGRLMQELNRLQTAVTNAFLA